MTSACPFLMFEGRAEEAMNLYVATIPDSQILEVVRYGAEGPGPQGSIMVARFTVAGLEVRCSDSFVKHAFTFTPSSSFFVTCGSEEEQEQIGRVLGEGGEWMMPFDNYGFSRRFGWVQDRFGVSWQLNLE